MTYDKAMKLAEEVFDEEYSGLDKDSFLIGFQEAYNALTALYKDKFELVRRMREAQKRQEYTDSTLDIKAMHECCKLTKQRESEVGEYLKDFK